MNFFRLEKTYNCLFFYGTPFLNGLNQSRVEAVGLIFLGIVFL